MIFKILYNNIHAVKREKGRKSKDVWNIGKHTSEFPIMKDISSSLLQKHQIKESEKKSKLLKADTSKSLQPVQDIVDPVAEIMAICLGGFFVLVVFITVIMILL